MRIIHLTAGAGGRICGSCLHDNTLVRALRREGVDAILLPAYVPTTTDEENVAEHRVVLGGVNVWLQENLPLFRHTPRFIDRVFDSTRLLRWLSKRTVAMKPATLGSLTISSLLGEEGRHRKEVLNVVRCLTEDYGPDVVHLSNLLLCGLWPAVRRSMSAAIVCTLSGEDLFIDQLAPADRSRVEQLIARQASAVDRFVALDRFYLKECVRRFGLPEERCEVIPHGVDLEGFPDLVRRRESGGRTGLTDGVARIGFLSRICHEKGLHVLIDAMGMLLAAGRLVELWVAGATIESERAYIDACIKRARERGLVEERLKWLGQVDRAEKLSFYESIDLLAAPALHPEAKGLPVLEAFAAGVPVVASDSGAFPEYIGQSSTEERGLLHEPGSAAALAARIATLLDDPDRIERMGQAAHAVARSHYSAGLMASRHLQMYERMVAVRGA